MYEDAKDYNKIVEDLISDPHWKLTMELDSDLCGKQYLNGVYRVVEMLPSTVDRKNDFQKQIQHLYNPKRKASLIWGRLKTSFMLLATAYGMFFTYLTYNRGDEIKELEVQIDSLRAQSALLFDSIGVMRAHQQAVIKEANRDTTNKKSEPVQNSSIISSK